MKWSAYALFAAALLMGCSEQVDAPAEDENELDYLALDACAGTVCSEAELHTGDGPPANYAALNCTLAALRDRDPGLYRIAYSYVITNLSSYSEVRINVLDSGQAYVSSHSDDRDEPYAAARLCELKPAAFFDECLQHIADDSFEAANCTQSGNWYASCEEQSPSCQ